MFLFDPRAGTGAFIRRLMLAEMSFGTADKVADDPLMADAFWQLGAALSHPNS